MKKRAIKNHKREPILEKEVSTPNGKYHLKLVEATEKLFSSSFDLEITHLHPRILELMLGEDKKIYPDACHDFEGIYPKHGRVIFSNTNPQE